MSYTVRLGPAEKPEGTYEAILIRPSDMQGFYIMQDTRTGKTYREHYTQITPRPQAQGAEGTTVNAGVEGPAGAGGANPVPGAERIQTSDLVSCGTLTRSERVVLRVRQSPDADSEAQPGVPSGEANLL